MADVGVPIPEMSSKTLFESSAIKKANDRFCRLVKVDCRSLSSSSPGIMKGPIPVIQAHAVSKAAEAAITAVGGTVTLVPLPFKGENKAGRPPVRGNQFTNR